MRHVRLQVPGDDDFLALTQAQAVDDLSGWATAAVTRLAERRGKRLRGRQAAPLVEHLEAVGRHYLQVGGTGCLLLVPGGELPVRALVRLETFDGPETLEAFQEQCQLMIPPLSWLVDPVAVVEVQTPAGPATRMHVRFADPGSRDAAVRDTTYWSWWFADLPETVLVSVAFEDTAAASRWLPAVDRVVQAIGRADGPGAVSSQLPEGDYAG